ncbi:PKD domain-containing protein [Paracrocinitomix mangrovi]|uniref:PKD domain-containing protein n=1 Tax=Paracrocinitomix mangrovi TaxID=2862509 RepID=UPI001C8E3AB1|nr:PKD domain-containing protein [Paracrocinitomix mangrovi]UKN02992.1 PKD domain-containing protein [Paracrocinitomix mangrovi]
MKYSLKMLTKRLIKTKLRSFIVTAILCCGVTSFAQQDTIFWFAAPDISSGAGDTPVHLRLLSYDQAATVTISQPANGGFTPIVVNIPANSVSNVDLSSFLADIESPAADVVSNTGLKIESTEIISAYYELSNASNKEIFSLKGNKGLGDNFYTPFQKAWDNASISPSTYSSIEIVATENNTTVVITPKTNIVGHSVGATFNITLNEGETYSARDVNLSASTSLAGSIVSSDKPVSVTVFSGALQYDGCNSSMGDQITPADYLGTDFIIHKGTTDDKVYILGTQNNTAITISDLGTTNSLVNWSETYEYDLNDTYNHIHTTKPVYVWHASGLGCNLGGAQVPNVFCAGKYDQSFTRSTADSLGVFLWIRTGFEGDFQLNGNSTLIQASDFTVVPGTSGEFMMALKFFNTTQVPVGSYNKVTNTGDIFGLGIINGETTEGAGYAYLSEFSSYPYVDAGLDATICQNVPFNLNGIVGGGDVTGTWSGTGFGSFSSPLNSLTNTYNPSVIDTIISPISLILTSTGPCPEMKDTLILTVTPAPIVNAGADQVVCANDPNVDLSGNVTGGATGGIWSSMGSGTFTPSNTDLNATYVPSPADTIAGSVNIILTSTGSGSCIDVTDTMNITISPAPDADIAQDTIYACSNNPNITLSGTVTGGTTTGKWTTSGNGVFSPDNLSLNCTYTPSPADIVSGQIMIYLTSTNNGLCFSDKDSVVIVFTPSPDVSAGTDLFACTNESGVVLNGAISGATTTGVWTGGAGTFIPNPNTLDAQYIPSAAEVTAGSVTLTLTSTNNGNCLSDNDQVDIDFVAPPFANFNFNSACQNDTVYVEDFSLNGFGVITSWMYDFGDGITSNNPDDFHLYNSSGNFDIQLVVQSDAGCIDTLTQSVTVYDLPVADFTYSPTCDNDQVIVYFNDASTIGSGSITNWYYDFGGMGNQSVQNPNQLFVGTGNFTITQIVSSNQGCSDTITQVLSVPPKPNAGFFYNTSGGLNVGAEFTFIDTSSNAATYSWDFGNGETSTDQNPTVVYFANGNYDVVLVATGPLGCIDSASQVITINTVTTEITQLIPNAISPNGDNINDVWKLEFIQYTNTDAQIVIVNRWGQTVFESVGYANPWDGTFQGTGELVPEGNYYYIIKISDDEIYEGALLVLISANN